MRDFVLERPLLESLDPSRYAELKAALQPHGGIATCEEIVRILYGRMDQPISRLARWIVEREVLSVQWEARIMLPLFQFEPVSMLPRRAVREVAQELAAVLDDGALALWFVRPNDLLDGSAPVDALGGSVPLVVDAARTQQVLMRESRLRAFDTGM